MTLALLCGFALLAGFIDSIGGGGGLIQLPALLILRADLPVPALLGTNKLSSITGTGAATWSYLRRVNLDWSLMLPCVITALIFSAIGARIASVLDNALFRPVILVLLVVVAIYTFLRKDFGAQHRPVVVGTRQRVYGVLIGGSMGLYDGFFGPGTGSFLMFLFIGVLGLDFLHASASAKVINLATNLAAFLTFAAQGLVVYQLALPMALCNVIGGMLGSRVALKVGSQFVRRVFLVVVVAFIARLSYDVYVMYVH